MLFRMKSKIGSISALIALLLFALCIQPNAQITAQRISEVAETALTTSLESFVELLSMPNDAYQPEDLEPNIEYLLAKFDKLGFHMDRLETEGIDVLMAEKTMDASAKTLLIYLQVDGQPVDPTKWFQDDPYSPVLKAQTNEGWTKIPWSSLKETIDHDWRIFARSTSDAKGPIAAFLTALQIMNEQEWKTNFNIKVILDCEEELGSPNLPAAVQKYREKLAADMLIIFDGPRHISNQPTLTFGARGITTMRLTTYGPRVAQHSGHYGNYAPNPAFGMARLLASMKDDQGIVTIPGFYAGVDLDEATKQVLAQVPDDETAIQKSIGIAKPDGVASTYQEAIQYPSLNVRGMASAWVGTKVRTIVPSAAVVNIDVRTVKESDPRRLVQLITDHIAGQGYHICEGEPTEEERMKYSKLISMSHNISYGAFRTEFDSEVGKWLGSSTDQGV